MNFIEAINLLNTKSVKGVKRPNWKGFKYIFHDTNSGALRAMTGMGSVEVDLSYPAEIDQILADDWEIYEEQAKLFTFEQAIAALKDGKDIKRKMWTTKVIKRDFCDDQSISFTIDDFEANDWIIIGG